MSAETRGRSPSVSQTQSTSRRRSPSRESVQDSADTYLKIIDISLSGQRRSIQAESRNADEIIELLKDVSPVPKDTARIYLTHDVTSLAVFNFSKDINEALLPPPLPRDVPGLGYSKYDIIPAGVPTGLPVFPWRVGSYGDLDYQPLDVASLRQLWENPNGKGCRLCTQRYTYKRDGAFSSLDFTNKDKAARMEVSVSWSSVAFVDSGSVVILCPTRNRSQSGCVFGSLIETKCRSDRLFSPAAFISHSNATRMHFTQLLLLDLLQVNQDLFARISRSLLELTISAAFSDDWRATKCAAKYAIHVAKSEKNLLMADDMITMAEFITQRLRRAELSAPFSGHSDSPREQQSTHAVAALTDRLEDFRSELCQSATWARRLIDQEERTHQLSKELREVDQSFRAYWLTTLAAIFLPLSLATSVLSMQTRVTDLHFLLYDFVGVAIVIGSLLMLVSPTLRLLFTARSFWHRQRVLKKMTRNAIEDEEKEANVDEDVLRKKRRRQKQVEVLHRASLRLPFYAFWMLALASFLVGMIFDVGLGLKILGYGVATEAGLLIVFFSALFLSVVSVVFVYIFQISGLGYQDWFRKKWRKLFTKKERAEEKV